MPFRVGASIPLLTIEDRNGMRVIQVPDEPDKRGLDGQLVADLPDPYHGSICDWARQLNASTRWMDDEQYQALMSIELPTGVRIGPWFGQHMRHDVALVIAREDIAKAAARTEVSHFVGATRTARITTTLQNVRSTERLDISFAA